MRRSRHAYDMHPPTRLVCFALPKLPQNPCSQVLHSLLLYKLRLPLLNKRVKKADMPNRQVNLLCHEIRCVSMSKSHIKRKRQIATTRHLLLDTVIVEEVRLRLRA